MICLEVWALKRWNICVTKRLLVCCLKAQTISNVMTYKRSWRSCHDVAEEELPKWRFSRSSLLFLRSTIIILVGGGEKKSWFAGSVKKSSRTCADLRIFDFPYFTTPYWRWNSLSNWRVQNQGNQTGPTPPSLISLHTLNVGTMDWMIIALSIFAFFLCLWWLITSFAQFDYHRRIVQLV